MFNFLKKNKKRQSRGIWDDPIDCHLLETPLQDSGSYKALSYSWKIGEDDNRLLRIWCNKLSVHVSCNLFSALRQLRHERETLKIWVDSICINQQDDNERSSQVSMMRDIYAGSSEVVIWLGESGPNDHLGEMILPMLKADEVANLYQWYGDGRDRPKLEAYVSKETENRRVSASKIDSIDIFGAFYVLDILASGVEASAIQELRHIVKSGSILRGLDALIQPRWWSRAWVVQEVAVAKIASIRYGKLSAPWSIFADAASMYEKARLMGNADSAYPYLKEQSLARFSRMILEIESTRNDWKEFKPVGLLYLLRKFRARLSTDERDKIFAFLGLVRYWRYNEKKISPDYNVNIVKISLETTKNLLASVGSLSVLAGTLRESEQVVDSNPSWVIDWSYRPTNNENIRLSNFPWYQAGGNQGLIELHHNRLLKVESTHFDTILSVGVVLLETTITRMRPVLSDWTALCAQFLDTQPSFSTAPYIGGGSLGDAFWRTICGDLEFVELDAGVHGVTSDSPAWEAVKKGFRKATMGGADAFEQLRRVDHSHRRTTSIVGGFWQESDSPGYLSAERNAFHHAVECACEGRRFFVTRKGYIGIGPSKAAVGDHVVVLHGSQVPFIINLMEGKDAVSCQGHAIETLSSATGAQATYMPAGKDAKAPEQNRPCYEVHGELYHVVGDAYVHGIMGGEALKKGNGDGENMSKICLI